MSDTHFFLKQDGTLWGCGQNQYAQLGLGYANSESDIQVYDLTQIPISDVKDLASGITHTIFLKQDGTLWGCGNNQYGGLGLGDKEKRLTPVQLPFNATGIRKLICGNWNTTILKSDGTMWGCGSNYSGELAQQRSVTVCTSLTQIPIDNVEDFYTRYAFTLVLKKDRSLWSCGYNANGELGNGTTSNAYTFERVRIPAPVAKVITGSSHTIVLDINGDLWGFGYNLHGSLGLGDTANRLSPVRIPIENVQDYIVGNEHVIARKTDGTYWGWGWNEFGQLALGDTQNRLSPAPLTQDFFAHPLEESLSGAYILMDDGTVKYFGWSPLLKGNVTTPTIVPQVQGMRPFLENDLSMSTPRYLLQNGGSIQTIENGDAVTLAGAEVDSVLFETRGFRDLQEAVSVLNQNMSEVEILMYNPLWKHSNINIYYTPKPQLILPVGDIRITAYDAIKSVSLTTTGTGGTVMVALSVDKGATWKTYKNGAWAAIQPTVDAVGADGIPPAELAAIPAAKWAEIKSDTIRFAYYLAKSSASDTLAVDALTITGDTKESWNRAAFGADYTYGYPSGDVMEVKLLTDGTYKINYGGGGGAAGDTVVAATLSAVGWTGTAAPYSCAYQNAQIKADSIVELAPGQGISAEQLTAIQSANIVGGAQTDGSISLLAYGAKPTVDVPVVFVVRGGGTNVA